MPNKGFNIFDSRNYTQILDRLYELSDEDINMVVEHYVEREDNSADATFYSFVMQKAQQDVKMIKAFVNFKQQNHEQANSFATEKDAMDNVPPSQQGDFWSMMNPTITNEK